MLASNTDLAAPETEFLALIFEALLFMPSEFWLAPGDPREYSGELSKVEDEKE